MIPPTLAATAASEHHTDCSGHAAPKRAWQAIATLLFAFALAGNVAADTPAAADFAGGNGTQGDPFQISSLAELRKFMEIGQIFPNNAYYKLTANIEASDTATWLGGLGWQPVDATLMDGFDPAGFEIQNLHINRPTEDGVGFFKFAGAFCCLTLDNFKLAGGQITGRDNVGALVGSTGTVLTISNSIATATVSGRNNVGGLVGLMGGGAIVSSSASGTVTGTGNIVGGLVGNSGGATLTSSHATGHVTGKRQVGGLAGVFIQGSGNGLASSWASGQVDGDDRIGGLVGETAGQVSLSFATGAVTATGVNPVQAGYAIAGGQHGTQDAHSTADSWASGAVSSPLSGVGGLIGLNFGPISRSATIAGQTVSGGAASSSVGGLVGDNRGPITASRSASTVNASGAGVDSIGGLIGINAAGSGITSSYATGAVTAANAVRVGGLVGWHTAGTIAGSHAHGNVTGSDSTGGLIGLSTNLPINTSFATGAVSGASFVGGLIGNRGSGLTDTTFATGDVTATGDYAGGLIGFNSGIARKSYAKPGNVSGANYVGGLVGNNQGSIDRSYAIRTVIGINYVGGLLGQHTGSQGVNDCYAKGSVTGADKVGGLVGRNDVALNIVRCYASGTLTPTGAGSIGGLIGDNQSGGNSSDYWNQTTAPIGVGTGVTTGVTGLTSVQMMQQASFAGFVFGSPWLIDEGISTPYLDWAAVGVGASTTSLVSNANPSALGQNVPFTATVTGNAPSGTVLFQEGGNPISGCIAVTLMAGQAQCTIGGLALGTHAISAVYSGDGLNTGSTSPTVNQIVVPPSFDVDASIGQSKYDALTDGLLIVRYLNNLTGNALVAGALGQTATRTDPVQIKAYLDFIRPQLDIDGNGSFDAATDGVLIARYLLGLRGDSLVAGAVDLQLGVRKTAGDIETWIQMLLPQ
jgi:hypothetical protein